MKLGSEIVSRSRFNTTFVQKGCGNSELRAEIMRLYAAGNIRDVLRKRDTSVRQRLLAAVTSKAWTAVITLALIAEILWFMWAIAGGDLYLCTKCENCTVCAHWYLVGFVSTIVVVVDRVMQCSGYTFELYFSGLIYVLDAALLTISSVIIILQSLAFGFDWPLAPQLEAGAKVFRGLRLLQLAGPYANRLLLCLRRTVGRNKKRFVSAEHGFNLDLVYITPQLIGMSVPAARGCARVYRNPLTEVARFFEVFHPGHYMIVNVCPEMDYPTDKFSTGIFRSFNVNDHSPPLLEQFSEFLMLVEEWSADSEDNVMAIHCRGGKGRTGCLCCAWLLYLCMVEDSADALNYFAMRRTDIFDDSHVKSQGVETPSQRRYVEYVGQLLGTHLCYYPADVPDVQRLPIRLVSLEAESLFKKSFPDLAVMVQDEKTQAVLFTSAPGTESWDLSGVEVAGDIRITMVSQAPWAGGPTAGAAAEGSAPAAKLWLPFRKKKKKGHVLFFHFHTTFLRGTEWRLPTSAIDKACKEPKNFHPEGSLVLRFVECSERNEPLPLTASSQVKMSGNSPMPSTPSATPLSPSATPLTVPT